MEFGSQYYSHIIPGDFISMEVWASMTVCFTVVKYQDGLIAID